MFVPGLKYVFCIPRVYESNHLVAMLRYLNNLRIIPPVLIGEPGVHDVLKKERIVYHAARDLPVNYDIFITCGQGYLPFDRYWLEKSMEAGKINLEFMLYSNLNNSKVPFYVPKRTKFIHAMFVNDKKTSDNIKFFNKEILHFSCGSPVWDKFSTDEFKEQVDEIKNRYGDKLLVVGAGGDRIPEDIAYCDKMVRWAKSLGYHVMLQLHPELPDGRFPKERFTGHVNLEYTNHAMFKAASHVISFIHSAMTPECLYLGANVACKPLATTIEDGDKVFWVYDTKQWYQWARTYFDEDILEILPLVHNEETLANFLSSDRNNNIRRVVEKVFAWPKVPSITEHIFRTIEANFGKDYELNVKRILRKNELNKGLVVDFSFWDIEEDISQFNGVNDLLGFINVGMNYLKQDKVFEGYNFLKRAEMFSGTEHFDFVQYTLAVCFYVAGQLDDAENYIYRSLVVKPNEKKYLALQTRIQKQKTQCCAGIVS